jgi:hypothetical protein
MIGEFFFLFSTDSSPFGMDDTQIRFIVKNQNEKGFWEALSEFFYAVRQLKFWMLCVCLFNTE